MSKQQFIISDEYQQMRLDQALAKLLPQYSRSQLQTALKADLIHVNGKNLPGKTRLQGGETIDVHPIPVKILTHSAQAIALNIVYEDDSILIINKPAGLVVHPGAGQADQTLLNALLFHAPALTELPRAGILHRLDKNTSGLLAIAKTPLALRDLSAQLKARTLLRVYQAVVNGTFISGGKVTESIGRHPTARIRMAINETGKPACTHYRLVENFRAHAHLSLKLETGRTHQIRVHMQHIKHPLVGDKTYGGRTVLAKSMQNETIEILRQFPRQALHAIELGLTHPVTQEWLQWQAPLPDDMQELLAHLQQDKKGSL